MHYKTEYNDIETAITHEDGLAVVAIIFVVYTSTNLKIKNIFINAFVNFNLVGDNR